MKNYLTVNVNFCRGGSGVVGVWKNWEYSKRSASAVASGCLAELGDFCLGIKLSSCVNCELFYNKIFYNYDI